MAFSSGLISRQCGRQAFVRKGLFSGSFKRVYAILLSGLEKVRALKSTRTQSFTLIPAAGATLATPGRGRTAGAGTLNAEHSTLSAQVQEFISQHAGFERWAFRIQS
jgi:hypothetical protein